MARRISPKTRSLIFCLLGWLAIHLRVEGQVSDLVFHELNQTSGLSELTNVSVFKDSRGFVWLSSMDGLNRYDGRRTKVYRPVVNGIKIEPNINGKILEDRHGNIWFSSPDGIHCVNWQRDSLFSVVLKERESHQLLHLDDDSNLWVQVGDRLFKLPIESREPVPVGDWKASFTCALKDPAGRLTGLAGSFLANEPGLEILLRQPGGGFKNARFFVPNDPHGLPSLYVFYVHVENDTTLWLPTNLGLICFNPNQPEKFKQFKVPGFSAPFTFVSAAPWRKDSLWVASVSKGIFLFDQSGERFVRRDTIGYVGERAVDLRRVNNVFLDENEYLWLSIWEKGVYHASLKGRKFRHLLSPDTYSPPRSYAVSSLAEDAERNLWCAVPEAGIFVFDKRGVLTQSVNPFKDQFASRYGARPQRITCDAQGNVWLTSESGIIVWDKATSRFLPISNEYSVHVLQVDDNAYLMANDDGFTQIIRNKSGGSYRLVKTKIPSESRVLSLYWDAVDERLYASGDNLLNIYEGILDDNPRLIRPIRGAGYVNGYEKDHKKPWLWLATSKGMFRLDTKDFTLTLVNDKKGILNRALSDVRSDAADNLWLSSNSGLIKFNLASGASEYFTQSDGLQSLQFMNGCSAKLSNGSICFGGVNGVNVFMPSAVAPNPNQPLIHISNIVVNYSDTLNDVNPITLTGRTFNHDENTLTFQFIAIEYGAPLENSFKYRLVPYDPDTVFAATNGIARYPKLPKGDYVLQVFAANSDGVWSTEPKEFKIKILPHWTNTWQFMLAVALLTLILLYLIIRYRIAQIREKAELKTRSAENKMAALRAQMDPHFIFNSLNTVNGFIMRQDLKGAVEYVSQFSKLMRKTLEHSRVGAISLEQEIELLEIYMKIEARRFKDPFDYAISTGKEVDTYSLEIPSMLLQPFVENAIKHGLFHRKEPGGRINIAFLRENGSLKCVVEDNGVGRAKAAEMNAQQGRSHVSRGLQIVEERLQLLQISTPENGAIKTIDLFDLKGNATGTRVEILLPLDKVNPA